LKRVNTRYVDPKFLKRETVKNFIALLDNYDHKTGRPESISDTERKEVQTFLKNICKTDMMAFAMEWLKKEGVFEGKGVWG
jgi:hypothetical protein